MAQSRGVKGSSRPQPQGPAFSLALFWHADTRSLAGRLPEYREPRQPPSQEATQSCAVCSSCLLRTLGGLLPPHA